MEGRREIARLFARKYSEKGELSSQSMDVLTNLLLPMKLLRGTVLVHEGEVCKYIYYIERGLVRQSYVKKGRSLTEHIGYEGSIIMCIESLFNHEPSRLTVEALEPCKIYALPYDDMILVAHSSFEFCYLLMSIYKESLILSQQKADALRFSSARERYEQTLSLHPEIIRRTPLHIVASYLQMTPETLSRVRTGMNEDGEI
jgi:CRP-like cAMP-binding protein